MIKRSQPSIEDHTA